MKRVQAVAACAGEKLEEVMVEMNDTKKPAFLAKWPMGCVPTFEGEDGTLISESAAIAEHGEPSVIFRQQYLPYSQDGGLAHLHTTGHFL